MPNNPILNEEEVDNYRQRTFRFLRSLRLKTQRDAIQFANERGFIFFWPVKDALLPSLWGAVAGDRPVPNKHDDPANITWHWKDNLLDKKQWHYAKVLRKRSTILSLEMLPFFYALSPNYGDPCEDVRIAYQDGILSVEEKLIFDALDHEGPLDTINLRRAAGLSSQENTHRFNRALALLQQDFRILPIGVAESGAWHYAFVYELVHRHFPDIVDASRQVSEEKARMEILKKYFLSVGTAQTATIKKIFNWPLEDIQKTLDQLIQLDFIQPLPTKETPDKKRIIHSISQPPSMYVRS